MVKAIKIIEKEPTTNPSIPSIKFVIFIIPVMNTRKKIINNSNLKKFESCFNS